MYRESPELFKDDMGHLMEELDSAGYESCLFTVHSQAPDAIPKIAHSINYDHTIKYMIAMRPYLFSPQYLKMIIRSFSDIQENRLMINWVDAVRGNENFEGILDIQGDMFDKKVRRKYLEKFLQALDKVQMHREVDMPEALVSGHSPEARELAAKVSLYPATSYDPFRKNYMLYKQHNFKKIFVQVVLLVRDTDEEATIDLNTKVDERFRFGNTIAGSKETIKNKLLDLQNLGATDILVCNSFDGGHAERKRIHDFINELKMNGELI
jgi:hypothetical protein